MRTFADAQLGGRKQAVDKVSIEDVAVGVLIQTIEMEQSGCRGRAWWTGAPTRMDIILTLTRESKYSSFR